MNIAKHHRTVAIANPAGGDSARQEMRIATHDKRLQADCAEAGDFYCMDLFWRLETVSPDEIVFRYRVVSPTEAEARAKTEYIKTITLKTEDGRKVAARLSDRFEVQPLPPMNYKDTGRVKTGRREYIPQADGRVIAQDETQRGEVTRTLQRFMGTNYVVFTGESLVTAKSELVQFVFPGGLLGGGAEWTFHFKDVEPVNASVAIEP